MTEKPEEGGFLARWSRRKAQVREGLPLDEPAPAAGAAGAAEAAEAAGAPAAAPTLPGPPTPGGDALPIAAPPHGAAPGAAAAENGSATPPAEAPLPTMDDVARLSAESDFSPFIAKAVDPAVRNAALKKLFHGEPRFNVMDGLDVYIDDYGKPDPLPRSMLRMMQQARELGLLDDELVDQDKPPPDGPPDIAAVPSAPADTPALDEAADLQLQPDDAAGPEGAGPGPGPGLADESADVHRPARPEPGPGG